MNAEIKKRWVEALRLGQYKQGVGYLKTTHLIDKEKALTETRFCCLGVLCDLYEKEKGVSVIESGDKMLPDDVRKWAMLQKSNGDSVGIGYNLLPLAEHNDNGCSFFQIADAIEEQL